MSLDDSDSSVKLSSEEIYSILAANFIPEFLDIVIDLLKPLMRLTLTLLPRSGVLAAMVDLRAIIGDIAESFFGWDLCPLSFEKSSPFLFILIFLIVAALPNKFAECG